MKISRYFPETQDELVVVLAKHAQSAESVAMQAGHFMLYYDRQSAELLPCVEEAMTASHLQEIGRAFSSFPILTWNLGLQLLSGLTAPNKFVLIVVNDWQYVPKDVDRALFYERSQGLPQSYKQALSQYSPHVKLLQPGPVKTGLSTRPFFSEMNQRNQFRRHVEKMVRHGLLPPSAHVERTEQGIACSLPSDLLHAGRDFYCTGKSPDCAAQIAQMLFQVQQGTKCDCFVNLYPLACKTYVETGTALASDLFDVSIPCVINIGFPSSGIHSFADMVQNTEVSVHTC